MLVFLIGYMGSGKSTVGRKLASGLSYSFIDLDKFIENKIGKSIAEIFESQGEDAFREIEKNSLIELGNHRNTIISCGGGTPCFFDNMLWMKRLGTTIYLQMSPASLMHRLKQGASSRPLLKGKTDEDLLDYIVSSLAIREKFYLDAHITMKAESLKTAELQSKLLDLMK